MFGTCTFCSYEVVGVRCQDEGISMATAPSTCIKLTSSAFLRNILFTAFQRQDKHCRYLKQRRKRFLSAVDIVIIYPKVKVVIITDLGQRQNQHKMLKI